MKISALYLSHLIPFKIDVQHTADWWLGNLDDHWFESLESAVREEWGEEPLRIREGGVSPQDIFAPF